MREERPTPHDAYDLRLAGLPSPPGHIRAAHCVRVLEALRLAAERAVRLRVSGEGAAPGRKPGWLRAATDLTVTGLGHGSTVIRIEAPRVRPHVGPSLFDTSETPEDTCLDLVTDAVLAARANRSDASTLDAAVLEALRKMSVAVDHPEASWTLTARRRGRGGFRVDPSLDASAEAMLRAIPAPRADIVTGLLDTARHGKGSFRLVLDHGATLAGSLVPGLEGEALRPLWGKPVTMFGTVRFRPDGRPQAVEVRRVAERQPADDVFAEGPAPEGDALLRPLGRSVSRRQVAFARLDDLVGTWPGDEPIEDLLTQLDSM